MNERIGIGVPFVDLRRSIETRDLLSMLEGHCSTGLLGVHHNDEVLHGRVHRNDLHVVRDEMVRLFHEKQNDARISNQPIEIAEHAVAMNEVEAEPFAVGHFEILCETLVNVFAVGDRVENENVQFDL